MGYIDSPSGGNVFDNDGNLEIPGWLSATDGEFNGNLVVTDDINAGGQVTTTHAEINSTDSNHAVIVNKSGSSAGGLRGLDITVANEDEGATGINVEASGTGGYVASIIAQPASGGDENWGFMLPDTSGTPDGGLGFGWDTNMYREAPNQLRLDGSLAVDADPYNATSWNDNNEAATKGDIRDKLESLGGSIPTLTDIQAFEANASVDNIWVYNNINNLCRYGTEVFDPAGRYNPSTNAYSYTAQVNGVYHFEAKIALPTSGSGYMLFRTATTTKATSMTLVPSNIMFTMISDIYLTAGQTMQAYLYWTGGVEGWANQSDQSIFKGHLVGTA